MHTIYQGDDPGTEEPIGPDDIDAPAPDENRPDDWKDPNEPDSPSTEQPVGDPVQPVSV